MFPRKNLPRRRGVALLLGLLLFGTAVAFALRHVNLSPLGQAKPGQLLGLAAAVVVNLGLAGTLFWVITLSFDAAPPVSWRTMAAVISASALLNYLPAQAGSIGRTAYLKLRHNLPLRQSVLIMAIVAAVTVAAPVVCVLVLLGVRGTGAERWWLIASLMVLMAVCTGPVARRVLRRRVVGAWSWLPLRAVDLFVTSLRVWIAFAAVGHPISHAQALEIASGVVVVNLLSFTPNGLGLREWSVAGITSLMAPALAPIGVLATLLDRGVEAVVLVVLGLTAMVRLRRV